MPSFVDESKRCQHGYAVLGNVICPLCVKDRVQIICGDEQPSQEPFADLKAQARTMAQRRGNRDA